MSPTKPQGCGNIRFRNEPFIVAGYLLLSLWLLQDKNGHTYVTNCLDHQHQHQHKNGETKTQTKTRKNGEGEESGEYEYGGAGRAYSGEKDAKQSAEEEEVKPAEDQGYDDDVAADDDEGYGHRPGNHLSLF